jgi:hypothetical protein
MMLNAARDVAASFAALLAPDFTGITHFDVSIRSSLTRNFCPK